MRTPLTRNGLAERSIRIDKDLSALVLRQTDHPRKCVVGVIGGPGQVLGHDVREDALTTANNDKVLESIRDADITCLVLSEVDNVLRGSISWFRKARYSHSPGVSMVGLAGIEPATSALSVLRSNRLSYSPRSPVWRTYEATPRPPATGQPGLIRSKESWRPATPVHRLRARRSPGVCRPLRTTADSGRPALPSLRPRH